MSTMTRSLETFTARDLQSMEFPPLQFVVPGFRPDGSPITTHKRNWKVLAEMSYDELAKATGHTLDRRERHRERV